MSTWSTYLANLSKNTANNLASNNPDYALGSSVASGVGGILGKLFHKRPTNPTYQVNEGEQFAPSVGSGRHLNLDQNPEPFNGLSVFSQSLIAQPNQFRKSGWTDFLENYERNNPPTFKKRIY